MHSFTDQQARQEAIRAARVLSALELNDPAPVTDSALLSQLQSAEPGLSYTLNGLRKILKYLHGKGLCLLSFGGKSNLFDAEAADTWIATISSDGTDFLRGFGNDAPGVYRPKD